MNLSLSLSFCLVPRSRATEETRAGGASQDTAAASHGGGAATGRGQGLTLVHFSAQLEPCLSQENSLHTLNTP